MSFTKVLKSCSFLTSIKVIHLFCNRKKTTSKSSYKKDNIYSDNYQKLGSIASSKLSKIFILLKTLIHYSKTKRSLYNSKQQQQQKKNFRNLYQNSDSKWSKCHVFKENMKKPSFNWK